MAKKFSFQSVEEATASKTLIPAPKVTGTGRPPTPINKLKPTVRPN